MDWLGVDFPVAIYSVVELDSSAPQATIDWLALLPAALLVAIIAVAIVAARRAERWSFWCAIAGRDVVAEARGGCVQSCSAFEDPTAITCARRCADAAFRRQWPPALPLLVSSRGSA